MVVVVGLEGGFKLVTDCDQVTDSSHSSGTIICSKVLIRVAQHKAGGISNGMDGRKGGGKKSGWGQGGCCDSRSGLLHPAVSLRS